MEAQSKYCEYFPSASFLYYTFTTTSKMTQKTWFLPPDFTFLPDSELALGTIIQNPQRPTRSLASLGPDSTHPEILLPKVETLIEVGHSHSRTTNLSICSKLYTRFIEIVSASTSADWSHYKNTSFTDVGLETRVFGQRINEETLQAILGLPKVKKYMKRPVLGNRPVYIISGLRIAKDSFQVARVTDSKVSTSVAASGPATAGALPIEAGGNVDVSSGKNITDAYKTAPGVVFAYRLHVIRERENNEAETELFGHRTAFLTGDGGDEEEDEEELVCEDVTVDIIRDDLNIRVGFENFLLKGGNEETEEETYVMFNT
jgi:hypothetical protein